MRNPFASEADAYRTVWATIVALALVVAGAAIDRWVGVGVLVVEIVALIAWSARRGAREQPVRQAPPAHPGTEHRILVVANETVGGAELLAELRRRIVGVDGRVLVICPALNSPLKHWVSDEDGARREAQQRLDHSLAAMQAAGIDAQGEIGDSDPLRAIEDALRTFAPDELVVSTHPPGLSNWLEHDLVNAVAERFALPTTHVTVYVESVQPAAAAGS